MTVVLCLAIIVGIFLGDLWIKNHVELNVDRGETKEYFEGRIKIRKHYNKGMMLNILEQKRRLVAGISAVLSIVVFIFFLIFLGRKGNTLMKVGMSFLLGGAFSNTYDRLQRKYVVDYLSFGVKWKWLERLVFNVSDFCIMFGAMMVVLGSK